MTKKAFWALIVLNILVSVSNWLIYGWLPTYLREHFRLGLGVAGLSATLYPQAPAYLGLLIGGRWADQWGAVNPAGRMFVPALGYPALPPRPSSSWPRPTVAAVAVGALILFGLRQGFLWTRT